jgi:hypothetical protein
MGRQKSKWVSTCALRSNIQPIQERKRRKGNMRKRNESDREDRPLQQQRFRQKIKIRSKNNRKLTRAADVLSSDPLARAILGMSELMVDVFEYKQMTRAIDG